MRALTELEAQQFALILLSGCPPSQAVGYFLVEGDDGEAEERFLQAWPRQPEVLEAIRGLTGGEWHTLGEEERLQLALRKHYAELAFFLWSHNYNDLNGPDKMKADGCRQALEAKLAGLAGKEDQLADFYKDVLGAYQAQAKAAMTVKPVS
jgi:hypothetical protein